MVGMSNSSPTSAVRYDPHCQACWPDKNYPSLDKGAPHSHWGRAPQPNQPLLGAHRQNMKRPRAHAAVPRSQTRAGVTVGCGMRNKNNVQLAGGRDGYDGGDGRAG